MADDELERIELELLTAAIHRRYGFDFREHALPSLRRRVWNAVMAEGLATISALQERVLHEPPVMARLLDHLSATATTMFRDPSLFVALRERVIPQLRSHPFIRIWHAGCGTGEDVYSLAIVLLEEGVYERCRIYATDVNEGALKRAKDGVFGVGALGEWADGYARAGGRERLSDYYVTDGGRVIFRQALRRNVLFSQHDLVGDGPFNEFNLILCRNVMIYFEAGLQARVHRLLYASLRRYGVLGLGRKESLRGTPHEEDYEIVDADERLYRRSAWPGSS